MRDADDMEETNRGGNEMTTCTFWTPSGRCQRRNVLIRTLDDEEPYGLCFVHAPEDAAILGLITDVTGWCAASDEIPAD